jgi:hypothetical protein
MSTVLHPAGPEPAQTYWKRRLVVIVIAVVVLAVAGALIANGTSSGSAVQANPSPPPPVVSTVVTGTPTPTPSAGARASAAGTPATATPSASAAATSSASPSAKPKPSKTPTPEPVVCAVNTLRPTLTGKQQLKPKERSTFTLSLINGSGQTCTTTVNRDNFELRIYSGSDRIWSTKDCATIVKPMRRTLKAEQALEWKVVWNGLRSRSGCQPRPEIPRPGTYYATAQLTGAEPVQLLMTLRG